MTASSTQSKSSWTGTVLARKENGKTPALKSLMRPLWFQKHNSQQDRAAAQNHWRGLQRTIFFSSRAPLRLDSSYKDSGLAPRRLLR